jgi:hypothetical protein
MEELGPKRREDLRRIARGELEVEHPKMRSKAITALGHDEIEPDLSIEALRIALRDDEPVLKVRALRALCRLDPSAIAGETRALVGDPSTRPDVALAAARVAALIGGSEIVAELRDLRERFMPLVPSERSPSIVALDQLIEQAEHQ